MQRFTVKCVEVSTRLGNDNQPVTRAKFQGFDKHGCWSSFEIVCETGFYHVGQDYTADVYPPI